MGAWNIKLATASYNRANLLLSESLNETDKDRCWRNLLDVFPYSEQFDAQVSHQLAMCVKRNSIT